MGSWAGIDEFLAVAQARSFVQAARRLGCSTSQISREVARLEDRLGQRLFHRTTRHVGLTEAGERFFVPCHRLQEDRDEALGAMIDDAERLQGQLRLTCAVTYGERFVAPLLNRFMRLHAGVSVEMVLTNDVLDIVDRGLDLAVRFGRLADSRLVAVRLTSRTWRLCASPDYIQREGAPAALEDLAQHTCLRGASETWTFSQAGRAVTHRVHGRLRCNSGAAVVQAAIEGLGLCHLPDFYVDEHLQNGALVELLADSRAPEEGVWAVYPHRSHLPHKVRLLVEHLQAGLATIDRSHNP
jgi:DNA-binding transcriptional LysR family regulator